MIARECLPVNAYFIGSTMAHTLETLEPGTPVYAGTHRVGEVRGIYAEGEARNAELVVVHWTYNRDLDLAVPASEVASVTDAGVSLMNADPGAYSFLLPFDAGRFPTVHPLR